MRGNVERCIERQAPLDVSGRAGGARSEVTGPQEEGHAAVEEPEAAEEPATQPPAKRKAKKAGKPKAAASEAAESTTPQHRTAPSRSTSREPSAARPASAPRGGLESIAELLDECRGLRALALTLSTPVRPLC